MKITYAVIPIDGPVQSIDSGGTSAARRAVKITLKNLKRWCERLRQRTVARDFKNNRDNQLGGIKIPYGGNTMMTMIIDQEESRNRANENLENELRESLANNRSKLHCANFDDDCQLEFNNLTEDDEPPVRDLSRMEVITRVLRGLEGSFRSP